MIKQVIPKIKQAFTLCFLILFFCGCSSLCGCGAGGTESPTPTTPPKVGDLGQPISIETPAPTMTPVPTPVPTPTPQPVATLMSVGDNLMHMGIVNTGKQSDGSRNYDFMFEDIADLIQAADVSVINQETIFGGNDLDFSGYPYFNSPTEVGDAIAAAGFDVVLQATNHTLDQKQSGVENCIAFWKEHPEILMVGLHDPYEDESDVSERIPLLTVNDITFAVLNYTYGPNYEVLPSYARKMLNVLCSWNPQNGHIDFTTLNPQVLEDIKAAEEMADAVIVFPHWGTEYSTTPSKYQKEWARQMTEAGADLIIGAHPHVVQPVEWIQASNGNECLCYYSLGNYVSTQQDPISMLENMAWVTFRKTEKGTIIDKELSGSIPLVMQYSAGPLRFRGIYLLEEYTQDVADKHGIRSWGHKNLYVDDLWKWSDEILGDSVKTIQELTGIDHGQSGSAEETKQAE